MIVIMAQIYILSPIGRDKIWFRQAISQAGKGILFQSKVREFYIEEIIPESNFSSIFLGVITIKYKNMRMLKALKVVIKFQPIFHTQFSTTLQHMINVFSCVFRMKGQKQLTHNQTCTLMLCKIKKKVVKLLMVHR